MAEHQKQQPWIPPAIADAADPAAAAAAAVVAGADAAAAPAVPGPPTPGADASHFVGEQQQQQLQGAGVRAAAAAAAAAASAGAAAAVVVEGRSIRLGESVCPVHVQAVYCYTVSETDDSALKVCVCGGYNGQLSSCLLGLPTTAALEALLVLEQWQINLCRRTQDNT